MLWMGVCSVAHLSVAFRFCTEGARFKLKSFNAITCCHISRAMKERIINVENILRIMFALYNLTKASASPSEAQNFISFSWYETIVQFFRLQESILMCTITCVPCSYFAINFFLIVYTLISLCCSKWPEQDKLKDFNYTGRKDYTIPWRIS